MTIEDIKKLETILATYLAVLLIWNNRETIKEFLKDDRCNN